MPVAFTVAQHPAVEFKRQAAEDADSLLKGVGRSHTNKACRIIQIAFSAPLSGEEAVSPSPNGFLWASVFAYSNHHHLVLRPEDVWFAILSQLSFYIDAHAEELRSFFVEHEGQDKILFEGPGPVFEFDFAIVSQALGAMMAKKMKDTALYDWSVASVLFMGAMQKYFSFECCTMCGLPSVTLLGDVEDWKDILSRLDRLPQLGEEPTQFAEMLTPILEYFVLSFEQPQSSQVQSFWENIVHEDNMSGGPYYSGWICASAYWNEQGKASYRRQINASLRGVSYPYINSSDIPLGFASVPVKLHTEPELTECTMVAGSMSIRARSTHQTGDTVQPVSGWMMYEDCELPAHEVERGPREARESRKRRDAKNDG
ncbi:hypothetical protein VHEMI06039 [[Torrubiella] hemipterigena]|uniref:DUF4419 domain-containing protein n=1 Tax=[Torrubiella] hemipterigena TaxID=1531966 RepID=A0A0A1TII4_9HYPO|nr:hypothetical protein VHEMI06039 [[Torrubiella] hemipterigena]